MPNSQIPEIRIHPRVITQLIILAIIILLFMILFNQLKFMLTAFLGAVALYMMLRRPLFYLIYVKNWNVILISVLLMIASAVLIIYPLVWAGNVLISQLKPMLADTERMSRTIVTIDDYLRQNFGLRIITSENLNKIPTFVAQKFPTLIGATVSILLNLVLMYFLLWFMLVRNGQMERWVRDNLPMSHFNTSRLIGEINGMVMSNTVGIPLLAIIQGILATIGYMIFDVDKPIMWGVLTAIASVIPFIGTMAAWVPLVVFKFAEGDTTNAYWLVFWGLIVVGMSDNVIRLYTQKFIGDVHPIITVLGVIIGLNMFGFLGLIFGPLLLSGFILLVTIYYDEYVLTAEQKKERDLQKQEEEERQMREKAASLLK